MIQTDPMRSLAAWDLHCYLRSVLKGKTNIFFAENGHIFN